MDRYNTEYSATTTSLQTLKNAISEIVSSGELTDSDILALRYWMDDNRHLSGNYPFDKIYSIVDNILSDGVIDPGEKAQLLQIFNDEKICDDVPAHIDSLSGYHVCLTGTFTFAQRKELERTVTEYGCFVDKNVRYETYFLFVGGCVSSGWAYGNYGNKVKRAKELQEKGYDIHILGEDSLKDFLDTHKPNDTYSFQKCLELFDGLPDEELKIIQARVEGTINGHLKALYKSSNPLKTLIDKNILSECKSFNYSQALGMFARNELNSRIKALSLDIDFKKNMRLEVLIDWCKENIPDHIEDLFSDYSPYELNRSFLNSALLLQIQEYFDLKFPPQLYFET